MDGDSHQQGKSESGLGIRPGSRQGPVLTKPFLATSSPGWKAGLPWGRGAERVTWSPGRLAMEPRRRDGTRERKRRKKKGKRRSKGRWAWGARCWPTVQDILSLHHLFLLLLGVGQVYSQAPGLGLELVGVRFDFAAQRGSVGI